MWVPEPRIHAGTVWSLREKLYEFDKDKAQRQSLAVRHSKCGILLILSRVGHRYRLTLQLREKETAVRDAIIELFGKSVLAEKAGVWKQARTIHIPLSDRWDEVAQALNDLLIRGYGLPDGASLVFESYAKEHALLRTRLPGFGWAKSKVSRFVAFLVFLFRRS